MISTADLLDVTLMAEGETIQIPTPVCWSSAAADLACHQVGGPALGWSGGGPAPSLNPDEPIPGLGVGKSSLSSAATVGVTVEGSAPVNLNPPTAASMDCAVEGGQRRWTAVGDEHSRRALEIGGCTVTLPSLRTEGDQLDSACQAPSLDGKAADGQRALEASTGSRGAKESISEGGVFLSLIHI